VTSHALDSLPCHKLSHLFGLLPSSVTYFMDGPLGAGSSLERSFGRHYSLVRSSTLKNFWYLHCPKWIFSAFSGKRNLLSSQGYVVREDVGYTSQDMDYCLVVLVVNFNLVFQIFSVRRTRWPTCSYYLGAFASKASRDLVQFGWMFLLIRRRRRRFIF